MSKKKGAATPPPRGTGTGAGGPRKPSRRRRAAGKGLQLPKKQRTALSPAASKPPRASPQELLAGALEMGEMHDRLNLPARTVSLGVVPADALDGLVRSMSAAIIQAVSTPQGAPVGQGLKVDAKELADLLARQGDLFGGYRRIRSIREGGQHGQWIIDATRFLGRTLIWNQANVLLEEGTLDETTSSQLRERLKDIAAKEQKMLSGKTGARKDTLRLNALNDEQVSEVSARRNLFQGMVAVREDKNIDWTTLEGLADFYVSLVGGEADPAAPGGGTSVAPGQDPRATSRSG